MKGTGDVTDRRAGSKPDRPESLFSRTARFFAPVFAWRRRIPAVPLHCPYCGYDLRPLPKACPQCGATIANGRVSLPQAPDPLVSKLRLAIPPRDTNVPVERKVNDETEK